MEIINSETPDGQRPRRRFGSPLNRVHRESDVAEQTGATDDGEELTSAQQSLLKKAAVGVGLGMLVQSLMRNPRILSAEELRRVMHGMRDNRLVGIYLKAECDALGIGTLQRQTMTSEALTDSARNLTDPNSRRPI